MKMKDSFRCGYKVEARTLMEDMRVRKQRERYREQRRRQKEADERVEIRLAEKFTK